MPGVKITSLPVVSLQNSDVIPAGRTAGTTVGILGGEFLNRFSDLYTKTNTLSTNTIFVNDTPTIRLSYNNVTRLLTANLRETLDLTAWNGKLKLPTDIEIPPGAIMPFATNVAPDGWLLCDGSNSLPNGNGTFQGKTANFARLYAALGDTYGAAGTLPDLRGYFIRGFGVNSDGSASSNVFGQKQADAFQGHKHDIYDPRHGHTGSTDSAGKHRHDYQFWNDNQADVEFGEKQNDGEIETKQTSEAGEHSHTVTIDLNSTGVTVQNPRSDQTPGAGEVLGPGGIPRTANETRPKNVSLLYCIKY